MNDKNTKMSFKLRLLIKKNRAFFTLLLLISMGFIAYTTFENIVKETLALKQVPVASTTIQEGTIISESDISYIEMPQVAVIDGIVENKDDLVGKVVNYGNSFAKGSMFYSELLANKEDVKDIKFLELEQGQVAVNLNVNTITSYANSIRIGHKIDLFFSGTGVEKDGEKEKVIYGELVKQAKVLNIYTVGDETTGIENSVLVVALSYEDADLVGRAKVFGEVFPIISYDSINEMNSEEFYDLNRMKDAIYQRTIDIQLHPTQKEGEN